MEQSIQFSVDDICLKYEEISKNKKESQMNSSSIIGHGLISIISPIASWSEYLLDEDGAMPLKDENQRDILDVLISNAYYLADSVRSLEGSGYYQYYDPSRVKTFAGDIISGIEILISMFPVEEQLSDISPLSKEQVQGARCIDSTFEYMLYTFNRFYSSQFNNDSFMFLADLKEYKRAIFDHFDALGIELLFSTGEKIKTFSDYVNLAVAPLVNNTRDHAFDEKNNIYGRKGFDRYIKLKFSWKDGVYVVKHIDNGFGIKPDVLPHIFEDGFTTREGDKDGHGRGLFGVKQLVEKNDGKINAYSIPGKETCFMFTIPYEKKDGIYLAQKKV